MHRDTPIIITAVIYYPYPVYYPHPLIQSLLLPSTIRLGP
jgi:hypothetical protein